MADFSNLGLKKDILFALTRLRRITPTQVQSRVIPIALQGKNVVFTSMTGSGKTLAYSLPFLSKLDKRQEVQMIILVPTRELCMQVGRELKTICDKLDLNVGMLYGGRDIKGDYRTTQKKNQIIVGTPGRLIQHIKEKNTRVGDVRFLVFDESDQMFDDGFYDECAYTKQRVSKNAQILLASATMTEKVQRFIDKEIKNYELLRIGIMIPKNIIQEKVFCKIEEKNGRLIKMLPSIKFRRAMIFCNTKIRCNEVSEFLNENGYRTRPLSGELEQKERDNNLGLFKQGKISILVTTDVAARGLHIEDVQLIVNYDIPTRSEFYIHRIGRTGRNALGGYALSFICPEDIERFRKIEELYGLDVKGFNRSIPDK